VSEPPQIISKPPGPKSRAAAARLAKAECPAFDARREAREEASGASQSPIVYARGEGANVFDVDGNRYVDLVAGFGALIFGHSPDAVKTAVLAQDETLLLALGDVYASDVKIDLCERLAAIFPEPGARVMLGLSGADALTAALKTVALTGRPRVVAFHGSYHGLSHGPLAACGLAPGFRTPFEGQTGEWVTFEPYPSDREIANRVLEDLRALAEREKDHPLTGAVLIEPVLGRGGVVELAPNFMKELRTLCDETGWLLVSDEIFTGCGRGGAISLTLKQLILPDILCLGKGLGAGIPISAMIGRAHVMELWGAHHGTAIHTATHFGAPGNCAAALVVLGALQDVDRKILSRVNDVGAKFKSALVAATKGRVDIRQRGLMIGVGLGGAPRALAVMRALLERGYIVLTGGPSSTVLTLTPPLDIEEELLFAFATALGEVLELHP
jgi:4-aminobutyrate aminotransferase / (S)-3-amino-2-methylpropionate transaminase / 5-aminovalerate transaminase